MDRLINMIVRRLTRQLTNKGISAGVDAMSGKGKGGAPQSKDALKRQKQAMRMMRRITRL